MLEHFIWTEAWRPQTIADCILPTKTRRELQAMVDQGDFPNLIFAGGPGIGKTTAARALCEETGAEYLLVNASMYGNIDTLRNDVREFASTASLDSGVRKKVILDEADGLNANSTQPALRAFMEEFASNCGFILTCNNPKRLIPALRESRVAEVSFAVPKSERPAVCSQFTKRLETILKAEGVEYDKKVVMALVMKFYPDWRRTINHLQKIAAAGPIDSGALDGSSVLRVDELFDLLRDKEFDKIRKWVTENQDLDLLSVMEKLYEGCDGRVTKRSVPALILRVAEYSYRAAFVADQQVNFLALMIELMSDSAVEFV